MYWYIYKKRKYFKLWDKDIFIEKDISRKKTYIFQVYSFWWVKFEKKLWRLLYKNGIYSLILPCKCNFDFESKVIRFYNIDSLNDYIKSL